MLNFYNVKIVYILFLKLTSKVNRLNESWRNTIIDEAQIKYKCHGNFFVKTDTILSK